MTVPRGRVLIVGNNPELAAALVSSAQLRAYQIDSCAGSLEALNWVRAHAVDVLITDLETSMSEDLALADEVLRIRPGVRVIVLAPRASREDIIASLRAHIFACFTVPFDFTSYKWRRQASIRICASRKLWKTSRSSSSSLSLPLKLSQ